jgi:hypothetical protein
VPDPPVIEAVKVPARLVPDNVMLQVPVNVAVSSPFKLMLTVKLWSTVGVVGVLVRVMVLT